MKDKLNFLVEKIYEFFRKDMDEQDIEKELRQYTCDSGIIDQAINTWSIKKIKEEGSVHEYKRNGHWR